MLKELPSLTYGESTVEHLPLETAEFFAWCGKQYGSPNAEVADAAVDFYLNFPNHLLNTPGEPGYYPGLLAVNKPSHISSQNGGRDNPYSIDTIARLATGISDIHCINRLDHDTSGVMLLGTTRQVRASLSKQLRAHTVHKKYLAILDGALNPKFAGIVAPLAQDHNCNHSYTIDAQSPDAKQSHTGIKFLATAVHRMTGATYSIVEIRLFTGRSHQIRSHMTHALGVPIVGDTLYNKNPSGADRQLLHSYQTTIWTPGPMERARTTITAPVPDDFNEFLDDKLILPQDDTFYEIFDRITPDFPPIAG